MIVFRRIAYILALLTLVSLSAYSQQEYPKHLQDEFKKPEAVQRQVTPNGTARQLKKEKGPWKPFGAMFWASTGVFAAGAIADYASSNSSTFQEHNRFLRNSRGGLHKGKYFAVNGAFYAVTLALERKWPKFASVLRYAAGGIKIGVAATN